MMPTYTAEIDEQGTVTLLEPAKFLTKRRALVVVLNEQEEPNECYLLSESALAKDWLRPEEDIAWAEFQKAR